MHLFPIQLFSIFAFASNLAEHNCIHSLEMFFFKFYEIQVLQYTLILNPPTPETFFSSDLHDFLKCCSRETPEKELREKYFFFHRKCTLLVWPKTSI